MKIYMYIKKTIIKLLKCYYDNIFKYLINICYKFKFQFVIIAIPIKNERIITDTIEEFI